jgi:putative transposase
VSILRYSYRLYPTAEQHAALIKLFGCVRVVWNDAVARAQDGVRYPGFTVASRLLTESKKTPERAWLNDVSSVALQQSIRNFDRTMQSFFNGLKGKGPRVGFPVWKHKGGRQSAEFTRSGFKLQQGKLYLAKIGHVAVRWSRELPSDPKTTTVTLDAAGRYHVSFTVEKVDLPIKGGEPVGVDLGIKTFAALSTGELVQAPDYSRLERRIEKAQRKLSRCEKGSNRRQRAKVRVAKLHVRLADARRDFLEKFSTRLVREHSLIALEDLNVSGMVKNHHLARAISRQGWRTFRTLIESKCRRYGREVRIVDRWAPTSQVCSGCGHRWGKLGLEVREVTCKKCGAVHDRDINAAKNIVAAGLAETQNGCGEWVSRPAPSGAGVPLGEASTAGVRPGISGLKTGEDANCPTVRRSERALFIREEAQ